ncbi:MAG: hypothetical protein HY842_04350 [Bacteroidetes bacterium]|nr:hypothetical protein [Bacteroidota bacterium]
MKRLIFFSALVPFSLLKLQGQDLPSGFKNWFSVGTEIRVNKKLTLDLSQLYCMNTGPNGLQFSQLSVGGEYKLHKNTYLLGGVEQFHFRTGSSFDLYHKLYTGIMFRKVFGLPLKNTLEVEWFLPQQKKHRIRGVYTLSYSLKNKFMPWKGKPFAKGQLYYYYAGAPLTYYGSDGEVLAYQAPNDFHRFRFTGGVVFKPLKKWNMTLYYAWNKEFNTGLTENRDLNIPSKNGTKIKYAFNNYSVLGLSFTYQLKLD